MRCNLTMKKLSLSLSLSDFVKSKPHKLLFVLLLAFVMASASFLFVAEAQAQAGFPLYTWGGGGALGRPTAPVPPEVPHNRPGRVGTDYWIYTATSGLSGSYAINVQGHLYSWGSAWTVAGMGQGAHPSPGVGNITEPTRVTHVAEVVGGPAIALDTVNWHWTRVAARGNHVAAINSQGELFRAGADLTDPVIPNVFTYVPNPSGSPWVYVALSNGTISVINANGELWTMGGGAAGGRPTTAPNPPGTELGRVGGANCTKVWRSISGGTTHVIGVTEDGALWSWGTGAAELGRPTTAPYPSGSFPGRIGDAYHWASVRTVNAGSAAITTDGRLFTWGAETGGQLGRDVDAANPANRPGQVGTADNWLFIMGGASHYLAFNEDFYLYAWGSGGAGQLGIGLNVNQSAPVRVFPSPLYGFSSSSRGGGSHNLMLMHTSPPAGGEFNLYKHLQKPEGTPAPNLTFTFTVERNSFNDNSTPADIDRIPVIGSITLNPTTVVSPAPPPAGTVTLRAYADILDSIAFTEAGIYSWIISEVQSATGIGPDSSVVFSQAQYDLRVYVFREPGPLGDYYVRFITLHRIQEADGTIPDVENGRRKVDNLIFVNLYSYDPFITPTGLFLRSGSPYLLLLATGALVTAYLTRRARKRIEELPIMQ